MSKENNEYQLTGRAYINGEILECSILIEGERIKRISKKEIEGVKKIAFSHEHLIIPAGIDLHVHFRDWLQSYKETIKTASLSAIAGGITTALDMPNTLPPVKDLQSLRKRYSDFKEKSLIDFGLHCRPPPFEELDEISKIAQAIKFYEEDLKLITVYKERLYNQRLVFHAQFGEDEISAVNFILKEAKFFKDMRFAHISKGKSLELIKESKEKRRIYIEVTPHHVFLSKKDVEKKHKGYSSVRPPLAEVEDNIALMDAINKGIVDFIASDHAPHSLEEKLSENPPPGYPSLEIMLPIFLTYASKGFLSIRKVLNCLTYNPARYLGINKGEIKEGFYADITILDTKNEFIVDPSNFISLSKFSPFEGWKISFKPIMTIIRGKIMFENGEFIVNDFKPKSIFEL